MPCSVVFCKSGYASCKEKIPLFHPPKDEETFLKWKKAIPKRDRELDRKATICAKHFQDEEILWYSQNSDGINKVRLTKPRLKEGAIPSIFLNCPQSCIPKVRKPRRKLIRKEIQSVASQNVSRLPENSQIILAERAEIREHPVEDSHNRKIPLVEDEPFTKESTDKVDEVEIVSEIETNHPASSIDNPVDGNFVQPSFRLWDVFNSLVYLMSSVANLVCITVGETKCIAEMTFSNHYLPTLTSVREIRTTNIINQVQCFLLGKAFDIPKIISSVEELTNFVTHFFSSSFCYGIPHSLEFENIITKKGYKNILNQWQSTKCLCRIESPNWSTCMQCHKLNNLFAIRKIREKNVLQRPATNCKMRTQSLLSSPEKKRMLNRRLKVITKAKNRLANVNIKLKNEIKNCQDKLKKLDDESIEDLITRLKIDAPQAMVLKEIIKIAKTDSKYGRRYSNDWLLTCLLMHIRSPAMYNFILVNEILPLPSSRTIRRRISSIKLECGFDPQFFAALKKKLESKTEQQKCGLLIFDEVSVRRSLKTDLKSMRYQGVVNFGDDDVDGQSTNKDDLADHALVFGFSSMCENYFQPIGCFAVKGSTKGVTLAKLLLQAIILLENAGVKVCGIICDGAKPNRRMWQEFGISGKLATFKNFIENPSDERRKIFFLSDMPHLFKCIRNRLTKHELMTKFGWVRWRHYQVLYHEDKKLPSNIRICPKLTKEHVYPSSFEKMRVHLMTQIFSVSTAIGLQKYRERLTEELEDSEPTEKFTRYFNNLFDALNRSYPGEGIQPGNSDIDTIQDGITFLDTWESEVHNGTITKDNFLTPETAEGLRVTLHSTLNLIHVLHSMGYKYVLTGKINQDKLKQFFGIIRQAGCQNDHPSLPTFLQLYRLLSVYKLLKPPKFGNCSVEDLKSNCTSGPPINMDDLKIIFSDKAPSESAIEKLKYQLDSLVEQDDWDAEESTAAIYSCPELEDIALYMACGYLCLRLLKMVKCNICREALLTKLESSEIAVADLVNAKTKGFLKYCNLYLYNLFRQTEIFFGNNVSFSNCYERTLSDVFENVNLTFPCDEHKSDILALSLHYYIVMRMRQYEREENRSLKKTTRKKKKEAKLSTS